MRIPAITFLLVTTALTGFSSIVSFDQSQTLPGKIVHQHEASRIHGGSSVDLFLTQAISNSALAYHQGMAVQTATPVTYCAGDTYSSCGGGACGTTTTTLITTGGTNTHLIQDIPHGCSLKLCGMGNITCGVYFTNQCG